MGMRKEELLSILEDTAEKLSIRLSYENLHRGEINTTGGICQLRGEHRMIIHKGLTVREKIDIITDLLSQVDTDGVHIAPGVREKIEAARAARH